MRVVHIISGLDVGGAEMMLYKLLSGMKSSEYECVVISLTSKGVIADKIKALGIPVYSLEMKNNFSSLFAPLKLCSILKRERPDVVQSWMYHADIIGGIIAKLMGCKAIVWNIRHSDLDVVKDKKTTILAAKLCAKLSSFVPSKIVSCSETALRIHKKLGYKAGKMVVIPNGFDLDMFRPSEEIRQRTRLALGLENDDIVIGLFGRFHPQKDHFTFILSAIGLCADFPRVKFLLCGRDVDWNNKKLASWIDGNNLRDKFFLLGERDDIASLTKVLDIAVSSSSHGEGFSNVIGEAMACGIPCVVTDIGDSAAIVGDAGSVVAPNDPKALEAAIAELTRLSEDEYEVLSKKCRQRIEQYFSLPSIIDQYEDIYREVSGSTVS